jgi:cytochrome P450
LGLGSGDRDALFLDFETWTRGLFSFPLAWPGTRLARARHARRRLLRRLEVVLQHAQTSAERGETLAAGDLDLLAGGLDEVGVPLRDDDVVEQLLLLLFAGYETTASSLSCLLLALLQHPEHYGWLQEEVDTLPWPPSADQAVTAYDGGRAPRLAAVVKEVMRLTPPVGGFFRFTKRSVLLSGVGIPAERVLQGSITRVALGKSLAVLEIRLLAVGLLKQLRLRLIDDQDLTLLVIPSPTPRDGLRVNVASTLSPH